MKKYITPEYKKEETESKDIITISYIQETNEDEKKLIYGISVNKFFNL